MTPNVPGSHEQSGNQAARKYASRLQRIYAKNLTPVIRVRTPVVNDVENFRPNNSGENNKNSKVPSIVAVNSLLLRIAHADPEPDQYARGDENSVSGQVEIANMKKSRKHVILDAPTDG